MDPVVSLNLRTSVGFLMKLQPDITQSLQRLCEATKRGIADSPEQREELLFAIKAVIHALAGLAEVVSYWLGLATEAAVRKGTITVNVKHLGLMLERRVARGQLTEEFARSALVKRVKYSQRYLPTLFGEPEASIQGPGWQSLQAVLAARKTLTHPKRLDHIYPTGALPHLSGALVWYIQEVTSLLRRFGARAADVPAIAVPVAKKTAPSAEEIFDKSFRDAVREDRGREIHVARLMRRQLTTELRLAMASMGSSSDYRQALRFTVACMEGTAGYVRLLLEGARDRGELTLTAEDLDASGSSRAPHHRYRAAALLWAKHFGFPERRLDDSEWSSVEAVVALRDGVVHPRHAHQIEPTTEKRRHLLNTRGWLIRSLDLFEVDVDRFLRDAATRKEEKLTPS